MKAVIPGHFTSYANAEYPRREHGSYEPPIGEGDRLPRTYRLEPATVQRLDAYCRQQGIWPSSLVQLLIADGLGRLERGELRLHRRPIMYEVELAG